MPKHLLEEMVEQLDDAFNRRDLEAHLRFYEDDAVLLLESGRRFRERGGSAKSFNLSSD